MNLSQVAAQLYTVREHCRTAADLARTVTRIRPIGYTAAQINGVGAIPEEEIARSRRSIHAVLAAS
jgi:hypothetical protein